MKRQAVHWIMVFAALLVTTGGWCTDVNQKTLLGLMEADCYSTAERLVGSLPPSPKRTLLRARILMAKGELPEGCRLIEGLEPSQVKNGDRLLFLQLKCRSTLKRPGAWRKAVELYHGYSDSPLLPQGLEAAPPPLGKIPSSEILKILKGRNSPGARILRAEALAAQGKSKRALGILKGIGKPTDNSTLKRLLWEKGALLSAMGDWGKAAKLFHQLEESADTPFEKERFSSAKAVALFKNGNSTSALEAVRSIISRPTSPSVLLGEGVEALVKGDRWRSERLLGQALQGTLPRRARLSVALLLARLLEKDGRIYAAVSTLQRDQSTTSGSQPPLLNSMVPQKGPSASPLLLARLLVRIDMPQQAREELKRVLTTRFSSKAAELLEKARGNNGEREETLVFLIQNGNLETRAEAFQELAELLFEEGRYQDLLDLLSAYLQEHPRDFPPEVMLLAAKAHVFSGDLGTAEALLKSLVAAEVGGAGELLARLLVSQGNPSEALKVLEETGEVTKAPFLSAELFQRAERTKDARKLLKRERDRCRAYLLQGLWTKGRRALELARKGEKACKGALKEWARYQRLLNEASLGRLEEALKEAESGSLCGVLLLESLGNLISEAQLPVVMKAYPPLTKDPSNWFKGEKALYTARRQEREGKRGAAIKTLKLALRRLKGSGFEPSMREELVKMLTKNLRFKEALRVVNQWPKGDEEESRDLLEARVLIELGRPQRAVYVLREEGRGTKWSRESRCQGMLLLGEAYEDTGEQKAAINTYRQWVNHSCPTTPTASKLIRIGLELEKANFDTEAERLLKRAISKGKKRTKVEAAFWLADLLEKEGKPRAALVHYLQVGYGLPQVFPWGITARYRAAVLLGKNPHTRKDALAILGRIAKNHQNDRWGEAALREMRRIEADENTRSTP